MLNIVTGLPGAGKTLWLLHHVYKTYRDAADRANWRPIYINNVEGINLEYFNAEPLDDPDRWYELPEGSIIVMDEAQRVFPQRPASVEVPQKCRQFETHRHRGYDVYLTTQDANTFDVHIRRLAGKHYHLKRVLGQELATVYEYDGYQPKPQDFFAVKEAVSQKPWKYPKEFYQVYKSATLHTVKKRYPWKLAIVPVGLIGVAVMGWMAFNSIGSSIPDNPNADESAQFDQFPEQKTNQIVYTETQYLAMNTPVVPGVLHTAPIYQEVYKPKVFPIPNCIIHGMKAQDVNDPSTDGQCKCYTQQITDYDTPDSYCRYWAINGFFDPTKEKEEQAPSRPHASQGPGANYHQADLDIFYE